MTARARVLAYNPTLVPTGDLPASVFDLTGPQWRGKVGVAPTNASFQAFVTAMRVEQGEARAKEFLAGLAANEPQIREGNAQILEDIDAGLIPVGLINHYYLGEIAAERGVAPEAMTAKLHFFGPGDTGALVNVAGVGVLDEGRRRTPTARAFVDYLLGTEAQTYFAQETFEYPVVAGNPAPAYAPALESIQGAGDRPQPARPARDDGRADRRIRPRPLTRRPPLAGWRCGAARRARALAVSRPRSSRSRSR